MFDTSSSVSMVNFKHVNVYSKTDLMFGSQWSNENVYDLFLVQYILILHLFIVNKIVR